jgi:hypothetical protein
MSMQRPEKAWREMLPLTLNQRKSAKIGQREIDPRKALDLIITLIKTRPPLQGTGFYTHTII